MPADRIALPRQLFRYVLAISWLHQLPLLALTILAFLLEVVPLELQRRIVNEVVKQRKFHAIVLLCAVYASAVVVQGATKLAMNVYRSWIAENAKRDLRRRVRAALGGTPVPVQAEAEAVAVSIIVAEVDPVGGFVGDSISEPLLQAGVLATVLAYILHLDRWMALAALALFLPQLIFVPLMQRAMNRRTGSRVWVLRQIGVGIVDHQRPRVDGDVAEARRIDRVLQLNMGVAKIKFTMNFLMNLCSHLQVIAALLLGGWWVLHQELEIGGVVAFISGIGRLNDPWGDLVNYYREISMNQVKYSLIANAVNQLGAQASDADNLPPVALAAGYR